MKKTHHISSVITYLLDLYGTDGIIYHTVAKIMDGENRDYISAVRTTKISLKNTIVCGPICREARLKILTEIFRIYL